MTSSQFPCIHRWDRPRTRGKGSNRACRNCGARPAGMAHVAVSRFRGEDVVVPCCERCRRAESVASRLLGSLITTTNSEETT